LLATPIFLERHWARVAQGVPSGLAPDPEHRNSRFLRHPAHPCNSLKYDRLGCFGVRFCLLSGSNI
jgi:hypothetical protein